MGWWGDGQVGGGGCFQSNTGFFSDSFFLIWKGLHRAQPLFNDTDSCTSQVYSINYKIQTIESTFIYDWEGKIYTHIPGKHTVRTNRTQLFRKLFSLSVCSALVRVCYHPFGGLALCIKTWSGRTFNSYRQ